MRDSAFLIGVIIFLLVSGTANAVNTSSWEFQTKEAFAGGKFENVILASDGSVHLGLKTHRIRTFAMTIWCSTEDTRGNRYFGTANPASILRLSDDRLEKIFETGEIAVTCMVADSKNNIYAGTMAGGKIFKCVPGEGTTLFCTLPEHYIWDMVLSDEALLVATGPEGRMYSVDMVGKFAVLYDSPDKHILSIAVAESRDSIYCGTSPKGLILEVSRDGRGRVVCDFPSSEVWSLVIAGKNLYAAVNSAPVVPPQDFLRAVEQARTQNPTQEGNPPPPPPKDAPQQPKGPVTSSIFRVEPDGNRDEIFTIPNSLISDLVTDAEGSIYASTSMQARVYRVCPDQRTSCVLLDMEEGQALTLGVSDGALAWIGTGNPGSVYVVEKGMPELGTYTSGVLDAKFPARWGNLSWDATGPLTVQTRSGNTSEPDATWSDWSDPVADPPLKIQSPDARYLQFRINWKADAKAVLKRVCVYYLIRNQRPRIISLNVADYMDKDKKVPAVKRVWWQAGDADGDPLVYRVWYRNVDDESWIPLTKERPYEATELLWNTISLPDGRYVIKVEVSDERNNPSSTSLSSMKESAPVLVDNEKPVVKDLSLKVSSEMVCSGIAEDSFSNIMRIEYAVDGGEWQFIYPVDTIFDSSREAFEFVVEGLSPGTHYVAVRVTDCNGNATILQKTFTIDQQDAE